MVTKCEIFFFFKEPNQFTKFTFKIGPLKRYVAESILLQRSNCNILGLKDTVVLFAKEVVNGSELKMLGNFCQVIAAAKLNVTSSVHVGGIDKLTYLVVLNLIRLPNRNFTNAAFLWPIELSLHRLKMTKTL